MKLTDSEAIAAFAELEKAGLKGADAATSFGHVCKLVGNIDYQSFLADIRTMRGNNDHETSCIIADRFGNDALRAVRILQEHA